MTFGSFTFWVRTGALFLFHSRRSTGALVLMVIVSVATLTFLSALAIGVNDTMVQNSVGLHSGHITAFDLPFSIQPKHLKIEGVTRVLKRVEIPGTLLNRHHTHPIRLIGVDPAAEEKSTVISKKTFEGRYLQNHENAIYLSKTVAEKLSVRPGSTLTFQPGENTTQIELTVAGVYHTGIDAFDRELSYCPHDALPFKNDTWSAAVFLKDGHEPDPIISEYQRMFPAGPDFISWKAMMPDLLQLIELNYLSMSVVMVLVFGVVSIGIASAFVIYIMRTLREYGIMKTMGVTPVEMTLLVLSEVVLMNLAACTIGSLLGVLAVGLAGQSGIDLGQWTSHNRYFAVSGIIFPRLTFYSLAAPPVLAISFSMLSAIWPISLVVRKKAADILRIH